MAQFKVAKMAVGLQPLLVFSGTAFESPVTNEFTLAKSLFTDFFRRDDPEKIDVEGLQAIVSISADEPNAAAGTDDVGSKPMLHFRMYRVLTKRASARLPRVELEEIGPRMDFLLGRSKMPDADMLKQALKQPKTGERTKKNISRTSIGDKIGRIHLGKQDLSGMQTRKMKGLKRSRDERNDGGEADVVKGEDGPKKKRTA